MEFRRHVNATRLILALTAVQLLAAVFGVFVLFGSAPASAAQTVPYKINFQGRLTDNSGNALSDGLYNVKFRLYDASTSGTNVWEGDRVRSTSDNRVQVTNGLFNIQFGDTTLGDPALSPTLFSNGTFPLYLEVELPTPATATCATNGCAAFTEGAMTPRQPLASTPYAFNSDTLDGLDSSAYGQISAANAFTGANTFTPASGVAITVRAAAATHSLDVKDSGNTIQAYFDANGVLNVGQTIQATVATVDLGTSGSSFRTGYFGTSVQTPALNAAAAGGTITTNLGTLRRTASGTTTLDLADAGATTLAVTNSGGGVAGISATGGLTIGTGKAVTVGAAAGISVSACGAGQYISSQAVSGGIVTGGSCVPGPSSTLQAAYANSTSPATITETAGDGLVFTTGTTVPTSDLLVLDNTASTGTATSNANALNIKYKGSGNIESAGLRIDFTPGTTSGGVWSGLRFAPTAGAATGVTQYGLKLENVTPGVGTDEGMYVGTGWDIGLDLQSGGIQLASQTDPATPATDELRIYAKNIAGRVMPKWISPSGIDTPFQSSFGFNRIAMMAPSGNGTTATTIMTNWGGSFTNNAGTFANPALASTNQTTSVRRARLTTATNSTTAIASHVPSALMAWRGNAAGLGGFFYTIRFNYATLTNVNGRSFVGLVDSVTAPTATDPTTSTTAGKLGVAINTNTGNLKWINNAAGTAPTVTDLGASYPVNTTDLYELIIYSIPNGAGITYRVQDISTNTTLTNTSVTTNIPTNTTFLAPEYWIADNGTVGAEAIDCAGWYLESDN